MILDVKEQTGQLMLHLKTLSIPGTINLVTVSLTAATRNSAMQHHH